MKTGRDEFNNFGVLKGGIMEVAANDGANISAFRPIGGSNTCSGDSGGPAFLIKKSKLYLVGVTSFGSAECSLGRTGFTSILSRSAKSFLKLAKRKLKK